MTLTLAPQQRAPDPDGDWAVDAATEVLVGARCATGNGELSRRFFSEDVADIAAAKALCAECPVMLECLEGAIDRREPAGVWGGQLFAGGRIITNKRRPGRPAAVARPGDLVPDLPVPVHLRRYLRSA